MELVVRDKDLTGFAVRIRQGSIRYIMEGRLAGTTIRRKITIGDADSMPAAEARDRAMNIRNMLRSGEDPGRVKPVEIEVPTFAEVAADYMTRWAAGKPGRKARQESATPGIHSLRKEGSEPRDGDLRQDEGVRDRHQRRPQVPRHAAD